MEDRYEICGKIGQGGLGAVYRGYDTRMNREVAIKRISTSGSDPELQEESTRQLIKEAGALASLQHPHIVTVYDVGSDEDGPYVVMELITGKTLDELIERAPLTWPDFRELAMQTQEALIAAHERDLIHSDLKPSNLMLAWLPSGKFQVKIVDFGLATLAQSQSKQDLESIEAVFGSIFFMPPEQFERTPLDARSDIYSMGCVYYQSLTGVYPFDGANGAEVMNAHLQHTVKPLKEVRADIPVWVCDWIMWLINRYPQDRPDSARESLSVFLKNDRIPNPAMSLGFPQPAAGPPRARLIIPGSTAQAVPTPAGNGPATQAIAKAKLVQTSQVPPLPSGSITQSAPQPLAPPEGFKPSVHSSPQDIPDARPTQSMGRAPAATASVRQIPLPVVPTKKPIKISKSARIGIGISTGLLLIMLGVFLMKFGKEKRNAKLVNDMVEQAETPGASEIKITDDTLQILLKAAAADPSDTEIQKIAKVLTLAKPVDSTDLDERIANFIIADSALTAKAKEILMGEVLLTRSNPSILPLMLKFSSSSADQTLAVAALQSIRRVSGDEQLEIILKILESTSNDRIRDAAEQNIVEILKKTNNIQGLAKKLKSAKDSSAKPDVQRSLQRLLGFSESIKPENR